MHMAKQSIKGRKKHSPAARRTAFLVFFLLVCGLGYFILSGRKLETTHYTISSEKITGTIRIAVFSDLHNHQYGIHNQELVRRTQQEQPDLILMLGDMVNDDDPDIGVVTALCAELKKIAPVYYILGNHEANLMYLKSGYQIPLDAYLIQDGISVLYQGETDVKIGENMIALGAFSMPEKEYSEETEQEKADFEKSNAFKIALSHYPSVFSRCLWDADFDLAFASHYHGGQIRIPGIGGIYHKDEGLFPKYSGGLYKLGRGTLIVSRGLGDHTIVPRIWNRPELVIVDVVQKD